MSVVPRAPKLALNGPGVMQSHELTVWNNRMPGGLTLGIAMHLVIPAFELFF